MLGMRIKHLREQAGFSQKKLSEKLDITNVQLSRYETGQRKPDPDMILRIADFFRVSIDYLFGREAAVHEPKPEYLNQQEKVLLEKCRENPPLKKVLFEISESPDHKITTFIKMWELLQNHEKH